VDYQAAFDYVLMPKIHVNANIDAIPDTCPHKPVVLKLLQGFEDRLKSGGGIYFWGDYGQGKSALAAIFLKYALIGLRKSCLWVRCIDYPGYVINNVTMSDGILIDSFARSCNLLILDEFQLNNSNIRFSESAIESLLRDRNDYKLSTIITGNVALSTISERYPAMLSAMQEALHPVYVSGHNFRTARIENAQKGQ
jgi:DNA replication protein DnaC